jgi:tetratricopeptide (TPR) repeat protein
VTQNPSNIFNAQKNLLIFYTYANLDQAVKLGEEIMREATDEVLLPIHNKELTLLMGNIYFLNSDFKAAKALYRNCIKLAPKPQLEAMVLNNLACTGWYHQREQERLKTIPE